MKAETADDPTVVAADGAPAERGERMLIKAVDRYVLLDQVGEGGMGEIFEAYDTKLDRRVALKFLRIDRPGAAAQQSLLHEAKALARLSHPNVVAVFDAGMHEDRMFVAMEFVDGQTLTDWYREATRGWQEVVELMLQAGRGLQAAHAHGLIHRDFKPGNVMVNERADGGLRARVLDFGIAVAGRAAPSLDGDSLSSVSGVQVDDGTGIVGTPAYMAPEQFLGDALDARCDQFSFCVALYRMLYGVAPFGNGDDRQTAVLEGKVRDPGRAAGVPLRLRAVVLRGLQANPEDRYPSIGLLLDDLGRVLGGKRRRLVLGSMAVAAFAVGGAAWSAASKEERCTGFERKLSGVWDDDRRSAVADAFHEIDKQFASESLTTVEDRLDAFANDWLVARTRACEDERDHSPVRAQRTQVCLHRQLQVTAALVDLLAEADVDVAKNAISAVARLPSPDACTTDNPLLAFIDTPPADRVAEIEAVEAELADAKALMLGGQWKRAQAVATVAVEKARAIEHDPLIARAELHAAQSNTRMTQIEPAKKGYQEALLHASSSGDVMQQAQALTGLCHIYGLDDNDVDTALMLCDHAEALLSKVGSPDEHVARIYLHRATALMEAREVNEARKAFEAALRLTEALPPGSRIQLSARNNIAALHGIRGDYAEAARIAAETVDWVTEHLGHHHPMRGTLLTAYGASLASQGKLEEARTALEEAIEITTAALGEEQAEVVANLHNLGVVHSKLGNPEAALETYLAALTIKRRIYPEGHLSVAATANNAASALLTLGRPEEALPYVEEALELWDAKVGPDSPAALAVRDTEVRALRALRRPIDLERLERLLGALEGSEADPSVHAGFEFLAAKVFDEQSGDRRRARRLARAAVERLSASQANDDDAEMLAWLEAHPAP